VDNIKLSSKSKLKLLKARKCSVPMLYGEERKERRAERVRLRKNKGII